MSNDKSAAQKVTLLARRTIRLESLTTEELVARAESWATLRDSSVEDTPTYEALQRSINHVARVLTHRANN